MAKKFVRGVTGVDNIEKFDKTLTDVNDLISDGQNTYVHTKKGTNESYYNLTDNIKSIKSTGNTINVDKSDDGTVNLNTNPKKVLEHNNLISNSQYVTIEHNEQSNTSQLKTPKLDNHLNTLNTKIATVESAIPKSLNTTNLINNTDKPFTMGYGITNTTWDNDKKWAFLDLTDPSVEKSKASEILPQGQFYNFKPKKGMTYTQSIMIDTDATFNPNGQAQNIWFSTQGSSSQPVRFEKLSDTTYRFWSSCTWDLEDIALRAFDLYDLYKILDFRNTGTYLAFYKPKLTTGNLPSDWSPAIEDTEAQLTALNSSLALKQNTIINSLSVGTSTNGSLTVLYSYPQKYQTTNGVLKTHIKSIANYANIETPEEEFYFIVKLNKSVSSVNFTLNEHDRRKFANIMTSYGANNTVCISGCVFTLSDSTLTVSTPNNTEQNYVITFSDII